MLQSAQVIDQRVKNGSDGQKHTRYYLRLLIGHQEVEADDLSANLV
jgi:hypothetical protein